MKPFLELSQGETMLKVQRSHFRSQSTITYNCTLTWQTYIIPLNPESYTYIKLTEHRPRIENKVQ